MLGAIIGDIVGSQYEWLNNKKKDFTLFTGACHYTDDSLMTLAIAQAFTLWRGRWREAEFQKFVIEKMVEMGRAHQAASWGKHFYEWFMYNPTPYNSYGNGAAMRVSPVGWISESEDEVRYFSRLVTEVSHDHPEGLKAAETCIFRKACRPKYFWCGWLQRSAATAVTVRILTSISAVGASIAQDCECRSEVVALKCVSASVKWRC